MSNIKSPVLFLVALLFGAIFLPLGQLFAATMTLAPATGVYTTGSTFTVRVAVNTQGAAINAADGTLSFNARELQVVSVSRGTSIFNLWTTEPTFSNTAGTISFSGGSPTGYTGNGGTIMTVTFRTLGAGSPRVSMTGGSVLAADGRGTNVLTSMGSGAYTVSAVENTPTPEAIVEYVPPANTPATPKITSDTHPDSTGWSKERTARLSWTLPGDVEAVRTLLDENPTSIPTKVYDSPIRDIVLPDLPEGVSYFHIQFQNEDGWGRVAHYRLAVDSSNPSDFVVALAPDSNLANPNQVLIATSTDTSGAPLARFVVTLNSGEPFTVTNEGGKGEIKLENLSPGRQSVMVEAFDAAGNTALTTFTFDIESFESPRFTDLPTVINSGVVPVFIGTTRPRSTVTVTLMQSGLEDRTYMVTSDETGVYRFIPEAALPDGVYRIKAIATDEFGAMSQSSEETSFVVQPAGLLRIGSFMISFFSLLIPLIALVFVTGIMSLYLLSRFRLWRKRIQAESGEVVVSIHEQIAAVETVLREYETDLAAGRKTNKLTTAEADLIGAVRAALRSAEKTMDKEARDVTDLTN